jgi:tetratricopeptide (TPR) repeat protein
MPKPRFKAAYVITAAVMLALAAVVLTLVAPRRDEVRAADAMRAEGHLLEALDLYQDTLARDPQDEGALWGVAATHLARRDSAMALEYLSRYLRRYPRGTHSTEARVALAKVRGEYVQAQKPSPELAPNPPPLVPPGPSREIQAAWERGEKLERHGRLLEAITAYAAIAQSSADGISRATALERMARCEARRPPFDYERVRHFYLRAQRVYRESNALADADRCQQLAYLAQEYARVKGEQEKLAKEQAEVAALAQKTVPEPGPREVFEEVLAAYRAGDDAAALQGASRLLNQVPAAQYIMGMIHARQGDWDAARRELEQYVAAEPTAEFAAEARRQLTAMSGKRPLLLDSFLRSAVKWRLDHEAPDVVPVTEVKPAPDPSDGPCLRLDPGQGTYTSFGKTEVVTITLRLFVPPSDAPQLPRLRWQLYGPKALTCAPLYLTAKGYQFFGQRDKPVLPTPGWQALTIDATKSVVSAQVDGRFIGEVPREADFTGLHIVAEETPRAALLYLDDVRVLEPIPTPEGQ